MYKSLESTHSKKLPETAIEGKLELRGEPGGNDRGHQQE